MNINEKMHNGRNGNVSNYLAFETDLHFPNIYEKPLSQFKEMAKSNMQVEKECPWTSTLISWSLIHFTQPF